MDTYNSIMQELGGETMIDKFTTGLLIGAIGGVITNTASFLEGAMNLTNFRTVDLIGAVLYAHNPPFSSNETAFSLLGHIFVSGILGILFIYWLPYVTNKFLILKGIVFSVFIWFSVYAVTTFVRLPGTIPTPLNTTLSDAANAIIFGATIAICLHWITAKEISFVFPAPAAPAMKSASTEEEKNDDQSS